MYIIGIYRISGALCIGTICFSCNLVDTYTALDQ